MAKNFFALSIFSNQHFSVKDSMMPKESIKMISLNIEKDKHLAQIIPFFKQQQADIILLQEVLFKDMARLENDLEMTGTFAEMEVKMCGEEKRSLGIATFSSYPVKKEINYYRGDPDCIPVSNKSDPLNTARAILVTELIKNRQKFRFINTHFTWTPDGEANEHQYEDLPKFLNLLSLYDDFILCGDLNAPRGKVIFDKISSLYKDNIPSQVTTTIDKNLHYAGNLQLVVDCLFSTPLYSVEEVKIHDSLSDHQAITAKVYHQVKPTN